MVHLRLLPVALALVACSDPNALHSFTGPTMGSTYEVKYVGSRPVATVRAAVESELAAFDATFSNWRLDSEIARVNAHADTAPFAVSARFAAVLQLALDVFRSHREAAQRPVSRGEAGAGAADRGGPVRGRAVARRPPRRRRAGWCGA
jgi:thiamine biosynthesis lipoprotein ApbE